MKLKNVKLKITYLNEIKVLSKLGRVLQLFSSFLPSVEPMLLPSEHFLHAFYYSLLLLLQDEFLAR